MQKWEEKKAKAIMNEWMNEKNEKLEKKVEWMKNDNQIDVEKILKEKDFF